MKPNRADEFMELLRPIESDLQNYARRMVWDETDLPDALNNALLKAVGNFDRYRPGASFKAWMLGILNGELFTINRRHQRISTREYQMEPEEIEALGITPDPGLAEMEAKDFQSIEEHLSDALVQALKSLSDPERAVLLLRSMQDFKYQEISETLDMPVGSVMAYLSRARCKMRLLLQNQVGKRKDQTL
jgi:RNA polymerase sigma-70 factor (ECF subfamily)